MGVRFEPEVRVHMQFHRVICAHDESRKVKIPLNQIVQDHSGSFLSLQKLEVNVNSDLCLPWVARYRDRYFVPKMTAGDFTGITGMYNYDAARMPDTLSNNVRAYSFSVLKGLYDDAKQEIQQLQQQQLPRKKGAPYEMKTFFLNGFRQEGGVECMLLPDCSLSVEDGNNHPLVDFVNYVLGNESTCKLLEYFSDHFYDTLYKFGVELHNSEAERTFPKSTSVRLKSPNAPSESVLVLPMGAVRKIGKYLDELERNCNMVYILEDQQEPSPTVSIRVPAKTEVEVVIEMELLSAVGLNDYDDVENSRLTQLLHEQGDEKLSGIFPELNPVVMARYYELVTRDTGEQLEDVVFGQTGA